MNSFASLALLSLQRDGCPDPGSPQECLLGSGGEVDGVKCLEDKEDHAIVKQVVKPKASTFGLDPSPAMFVCSFVEHICPLAPGKPPMACQCLRSSTSPAYRLGHKFDL